MSLLFVFEDQDMVNMKSDGIMGLSNDVSKLNYLEKAQSKGYLDHSKFALEINKKEEDSYFYYGDSIDNDMIDDSIFLPVTRSDYWTIEILGFHVNGVD